MTEYIDPETGRRYEVGPDGATHWINDPASDVPLATADKRPWYARKRVLLPATAVIAFALGTTGSNSETATTGARSGPTTVTTTTTATTTTATTTTATGEPITTTVTAPAAPAARAGKVTVTARPKTRTITKTRTVTKTVDSGGGNSGTDPHFGTCAEAKAAGYGPYYQGTDPEYDWYTDRDHDGIVCE